MTLVKQDRKLKFPFNTEYSIDNKVTWTALAANTEVIIDANTIATGINIEIRSTDVNATTLVGMDIGQDIHYFDKISINNGSKLVSIQSSFLGMHIGEFKLHNINNLEDISYAFRSAVINSVEISPAPSITTSNRMFVYASIGRIKKIDLGTVNSASLDAYGMFYNAHVRQLDGLDIKTEAANVGNLFQIADIEAMGNIKMGIITLSSSNLFNNMLGQYLPSLSMDSVGPASLYMLSFSSQTDTSYLPTLKINELTGGNMSAVPPHIKFGGIEYKVVNASTLYFYGNTKVFSKLNIPYNSTISALDVTGFGLIDRERAIYEKLDWFPEVTALSTVQSVGLSGALFVGSINRNYIKCIPSGQDMQLFYCTTYGTSKTAVFPTTPTVTLPDVSAIYFSVNGQTCTINGSVATVKDIDGTLLHTVNDTVDSVMFNYSGEEAYMLKGSKYTASGSTQTLTPTIMVENITTGANVSTHTPVIPAETSLVAIYKAHDTYNVKAVFNEYTVTGVFVRAYVKSFTDLDLTDEVGITEDITSEVINVCQDFFESAEINLIHTGGEVTRVVGR